MKLDLHKGAVVYVLGVGPAQVLRVRPDGGFDLRHPGGGEVSYTAEGKLGSSQVQRVYYHDPVVVEPIRNDRLWATYVRLSRALFDELNTLDRLGELADPEEAA